jgi:hypothetical protein
MAEITDLNQLYRHDGSVPVTEELLPWVRVIRTMNETEKKREQRRRRCRNAFGTRCHKDCSQCASPRSGSDLSLEAKEEDGFEYQADKPSSIPFMSLNGKNCGSVLNH